MKVKRLLSALTALAMTLSFGAVQTFASGGGDPEPTAGIEGVGEIMEADIGDNAPITEIDLPTDEAWDFLIDNLGLSKLLLGDLFDDEDLGKSDATILRPQEDGTYDEVEVDMSPTIIFKNPDVAIIASDSNSPLLITATAKVVGDAIFVENKAAAAVEAVEANPGADPPVVAKDAPNNLFFQMVASTKDIGADDFDEEEFSGTIGRAIVGTENDETEIEFIIEETDYVYEVTSVNPFEADYRPLDEEEVHGTILYPNGTVNQYADWSDYADIYDEDGEISTPASKDVAIAVSFAVEPSEPGVAGTTEGTILAAAYGLVNTDTAADNITNATAITAPLTPVEEINETGGFTSENLTAKSGTWSDLAFDHDGKTITSITANGSAIAKTSVWVDNDAGNYIRIKFGSTGSKALIVTMSEGTRYEGTVTVS